MNSNSPCMLLFTSRDANVMLEFHFMEKSLNMKIEETFGALLEMLLEFQYRLV